MQIFVSVSCSYTTQLIFIYFVVNDGLKLKPCFEETCIFRCASQTLSGNQSAVRGWLPWGFRHLEEKGESDQPYPLTSQGPN